jgi:hypothetical protein
MFSPEEISKSATDVTDALNGFSTGLAPSTTSLAQFRQSLAGANIFGQPTAETFKALAFVGATTADDFNKLRTATGRQSISTNTLAGLINKNITSINVFGNAVLKRAADFDRLGITLDSLVKGQESYVTSLDQQLDAVAQLGQVGTRIDFEKLTMLQEFGKPGQAQEYISSLVNAEDLRSPSYRALLGQISGIDVQEVIKIKGMGNFEQLEKQVAANANAQEDANKGLSAFAQAIKLLLENQWVKFITGIVAATVSLGLFVATMITQLRLLSAIKTLPGTPGTTTPGTTPPTTTPGGGAAVGIGAKLATGAKVGAGAGVFAGLVSGVAEYQQSGSIKRALGRGLANLAGSVIGGALGSFLGPIGMGIGATAGSFAANFLFDKVMGPALKADDILSSPGYGSRTLLTPTGTFSLNNKDTLVAGTNLLNRNTSNTSSVETSNLIRKVNELVEVLSNAKTTINVDNTVQQVPRMAMVGVYSRNERV